MIRSTNEEQVMSVLDAVKGMGELVKQVHDAELKAGLQQQVIDIQNECLALQEKLSTLRTENDALRAESSSLRARADIRGKIKHKDGHYIINDDMGERPICPACFEIGSNILPLTQCGHGAGRCPSCKAVYQKVFDYAPPRSPEPPRRHWQGI